MGSHGCRPLGRSASTVDFRGLVSGERLFDLKPFLSRPSTRPDVIRPSTACVLAHVRIDYDAGIFFVLLRSLPRFVMLWHGVAVFGFAVRFLIAD